LEQIPSSAKKDTEFSQVQPKRSNEPDVARTGWSPPRPPPLGPLPARESRRPRPLGFDPPDSLGPALASLGGAVSVLCELGSFAWAERERALPPPPFPPAVLALGVGPAVMSDGVVSGAAAGLVSVRVDELSRGFTPMILIAPGSTGSASSTFSLASLPRDLRGLDVSFARRIVAKVRKTAHQRGNPTHTPFVADASAALPLPPLVLLLLSFTPFCKFIQLISTLW
jgi:hypothetical protein